MTLSAGTPHLAQLWALLLLPLPLLVWWLLPRAPQAQAGGLRVPFFAALTAARTPRERSADWRRYLLDNWPRWLAVLAWLLLVLAAARPQWLGAPIALPQSGRDLLLAVDISGSMREADMVIGGQAVDRLTAVKAVAGDFIDRRVGDRIGLILFGSEAHVQVPLTFDRAAVRSLLFEAEIGLAGRETAIGDAIGLAVKRLRDQPNPERVLILLSDGENTAGALPPEKAAELAAAAGVRIYTIAFGADPRSLFGLPLGGSGIDEGALISIAERTGGRFFRARDVRELLGIYAALDQLEPVESDRISLRPIDELFAWPLAGALLLSALVALGRTGRALR